MQIGAIIEKGPLDWQIIQQVNGRGDISLSGSWLTTESEQLNIPKVFVRVVKEDTGDSIIPWQSAESCAKGKWNITVRNIPVGGLYRVETCLNHGENTAFEWAIRGDMIHHIGIGDVYVIAGQSNSAGYGKDPVYDPPELGIHVLRNSEKWDLASHPLNESTNTIHEENREGANPGHSPYLSFARQLKRELGYPIGLIQASLGGSPLSAWNPEENGILYRGMMKTIRSQGSRIKGVLWYQGCSDAVEDACDTYLGRFKSMVSHLRKDLEDQGLAFLTVQLNRLVSPADEVANRCWGKVREAQRQAAKQIPNVFVIPSTDSTLSDAIHNSSASNMVIGERLAKSALKNIYGKSFVFDAPDLLEARKVEDDKVLLMFENVYNRLYTYEVGADDLPFTVEDAGGFVEIKGYEQKDGNTITIILERKLQGECQVHGAYEQNPKAIITVDFASHLPMLSFYGVKVSNLK
jgi:sialate O-acetylesterase